MKTIKAKVYRLPTEYGVIWINEAGRLYLNKPDVFIDRWKSAHLYITPSDEEIKRNPSINEIKEGDWYTWEIDGGTVFYQCKLTNKDELNTLNTKYKSKAKKIIATTDPKLTKTTSFKDEKGFDGYEMRRLPEIPQSFIEEYCKAGGIDEVLVEYQSYGGYCNGVWEHSEYKPKLNHDNTIIISHVEEKMYSKDEVWHKVFMALSDFTDENSIDFREDLSTYTDKWIKENL